MSKLTVGQIEQISTLARLELSVDEKKQYATELSSVFEYIEMLDEVDTDGVVETCQVTGLVDVFREDEVRECDQKAKVKLIAQFPDRVGNLLKVKGVFGKK